VGVDVTSIKMRIDELPPMIREAINGKLLAWFIRCVGFEALAVVQRRTGRLTESQYQAKRKAI